MQEKCNSEILEQQSNIQGGQGAYGINSTSLFRERIPSESIEGSNSNGLCKRIDYNDSCLKKGGGGTGLLSRTSDKSSSSSKKLNKKSNASSNSSGMKDCHFTNQSENSSWEKSDQRHFDRLVKRNEILDIIGTNIDQIDSASGNEPCDSKSRFILFLSSLTMNYIGDYYKMNDQMSEIKEADGEGEETNMSPSKNMSSENLSNNKKYEKVTCMHCSNEK